MAVKKGFTLSEVMIAMTVLGVLAAILVPTVMKTMPSANNVMFKKAYSSVEKSVSNMISDEANYPSGAIWNNVGVPTACQIGGLNVECGFHNTETTQNGTMDKFFYFFKEQFNTTTDPVWTAGTHLGTFTTNDGIAWTVYVPATAFPLDNTVATGYTTFITFDVNQGSKSTNCSQVAYSNPTISACTGTTKPDTFRVQVRYDGKLLIPSGDTTAQGYLTEPINSTK